MQARLVVWTVTLVSAISLLVAAANMAPPPVANQRSAAQQLMKDGNFKEAYEAFQRLALDPADDPLQVGGDLQNAISCLRQLGRIDEVDAFREQVIAAHAGNWRLLQAAAESYLNTDHYGAIISGKFVRGHHRGPARMVNSTERDRARALQLLREAMPLVDKDDDRQAVGQFYMAFANAVLYNRAGSEAWRLQYLADLEQLPDYDEGWHGGGQPAGAPVDEQGNPIFYTVPAGFAAAESDGQRWRWALAQAREVDPNLTNNTLWQFASFLQNQFGVQTLAQFGVYLPRDAAADGEQPTGVFALDTLGEDETIARLATGVKRFKLPDEFNYIRIYQQIVDHAETGYDVQSFDALAGLFENRRQYPQAAKVWRQFIQRHGPGHENQRQKRLDQIVKAWGQFDGAATQPAGQGAEVGFRFRNGKRVEFVAHEILVDKLLADVKAYLKNDPREINWQQINIDDIGSRLVNENQTQYLGRETARWSLDLEPRPDHFDRRITVATPLSQAGAYLVTATMSDGNASQIVLWVADTAIVSKPMGTKTLYFIADAISGAPIERANVEYFAFKTIQEDRRRPRVVTQQFAELSNADGLIELPIAEEDNQFARLAIARTKSGRLAFLGFSHVWRTDYSDVWPQETKVYAITDRPVYRPDQSVKFKFWVREASYDLPDTSRFAGQTFQVEVHDPQGEKVLDKQFKADEYGGFDGELALTADAKLGVYQIYVVGMGGGSFRVEEYKKPEFEVTIDAPSKPVMLGEKITAVINARYYFGAPVVNAKVKYKVLRSSYNERWYPVGRWDWLYGPGYWWFGYDYDWYPGWRRWGCLRPTPAWWGFGQTPPEVVAETEVPIHSDGTVDVEIDTALAKAIHGDQDHRYTIQAEVTDSSRRTIVGTGEVLVAREPFKVFAWVDRGYYRVGDTIRASFSAHTLSHEPVKGAGALTLFNVRYDENRQPVETVVRTWELNTDAAGQAEQQIDASQPGQYRLAYQVTDAAGHVQQGAYVFTVRGEGFTGADFRFNHLELVPDQREYAPGDKVRLVVNTDLVDSTVLLFLRPSGGVYLPPKVVRIKGKSALVEIDVEKKDMPNFFIEGVTIAGGQLHNEVRDIVVPPESRVLDVAIEPSAEDYRPGDEADVKVTVKDEHGRPFVGSTVLTVYDKAVEYISGGSNVPEMKEFFWQWRRHFYSNGETSLAKSGYNLVKRGSLPMENLGIFGATVADDLDATRDGDRAKLGFGGGGIARYSAEMSSPAPADAMAEGAEPLAAVGAVPSKAPEGQPAAVVPAAVRTNFADTAFWAASLVTDGDGVATVRMKMPDSLTTWKVKSWTLGPGTRVGSANVEVITRKNLLVRMQTPRFFVETDEVVLSAIVHNYLETDKQVAVALETGGECLAALDELQRTVTVPAGGEQRVDWRVRVAHDGEALVRMKALTDEESDAVEMTFPAFVHGMLKLDAVAGSVRPGKDSSSFTLTVPEARRPADSRLEIRYTPTLAGAMVDALPFLVGYPYGCTEQTLNRFVPTVVVQKILLDMNLDLKAIRDKRTNLNAQELGDPDERARRWKQRDLEPVFDEDKVRDMVKVGVQTLTDMQLSDGGWGWFSGYGERSSPHTTATVVHGLQVAAACDVAIVPEVVERGVAWLAGYQDEQIRRLNNAATETQPFKRQADATDALVYGVLVDAGARNDAMREFLYRDRSHLGVYGMTLVALALDKQGRGEQFDMLMQNISQFVEQDDENQTAWLRLPDGNSWWRWFGDDIEAMACYLKLLSRTDPQGELAARLTKYLLNNRRNGYYWKSTRDTALCIEALAEYWRASGESAPDATIEVWLDGKKQKEVHVTAENLFSFDNALLLEGDAVTSGQHTVEIRRRGSGSVYYNGYLTTFTLEDFIPAAGLEVKVERKFYKLTPVDKEIKVAGAQGQAVDQRVEKYQRSEIPNLGELTSGDLVEIELTIDSKNDYEYLLFEDMKAAGFEPVEVQSGYNGNDLGAYVEFRDNRVAFFVGQLSRGRHSVAYRLRAEIPGSFSALPANASAMYAPELRGNSDEMKVKIHDAPEPTASAGD